MSEPDRADGFIREHQRCAGKPVNADNHPMTRKSGFKGNKAHLPSKTCCVCQREMTWRRAWAKNWGEVRYCSEACRRRQRQTRSTARD